MVHRRKINKKYVKHRLKYDVPQLMLPLDNGRQMPKMAIKQPAVVDDATTPRLRNRFIMVLNCALCAVLACLMFTEVLNKKDIPLSIDVEKISVADGKEKTSSAGEGEENFLVSALNRDEANDFKLFELEYVLQEDTPTFDVPAEDVHQQITHIDELNLSNEEVYHLYEEKLPEDVVVHEQPKQTPTLPMIAIVIDDMGVSVSRTKDIAGLKYPISVSFLTYAGNLKGQIANSIASGQEIMAHLPMEPQVMQHFTPTMLTTKMKPDEVLSSLRKMLEAVPQAVVVNNHMGSRFTEDKERMTVVMKELAERGIGFLDSKTTSRSVGPELAKRFGVKLTMRNVFLDNKDDFNYITGQLKQTEDIARSKGYAIAIGHPKAQTYLALKAWLPTVEKKGLRLVPLSELSKHINP